MSFRHSVQRWVGGGEMALLALAALTVLFMMALTGIDVVGRYAFAAPVAGAFELTESAMAIAVFSALPIVSLRRRHIAADLFDTLLNDQAKVAQRVLADAAGLVFFALVAWRLWREAGEVAAYGTTAGILELPLAPLTYYAAFLSGLTAAVFVARFAGLAPSARGNAPS